MILATLRRAAVQWQADRASYLGAAIAYYALFSIGPLLVVAVAVVGLVYGKAATEGKLVAVLAEHIGPDAARTVQGLVHHAEPGSGWAALIGGVVLLFAALGLFQQLKIALGVIWKLPPRADEGVVVGTVRAYLLALFGLLVAVVLGVVAIGGGTALTLFVQVWGDTLLKDPLLYRLAVFGAALLVQTVVLVFLFRLFSEGRIAHRHLWGGALTTALLFVLGKWLFGFYLASGVLQTTYGAASSLVVFLVWVYYSAQIVFFGAEVVQTQRTAGSPGQ